MSILVDVAFLISECSTVKMLLLHGWVTVQQFAFVCYLILIGQSDLIPSFDFLYFPYLIPPLHLCQFSPHLLLFILLDGTHVLVMVLYKKSSEVYDFLKDGIILRVT